MTRIEVGYSTYISVETVYLLGSWDNYTARPLFQAAIAGHWQGFFKATVQAGKRYWYYYLTDGHPTYDPTKPITVEPTTGQTLNILDVSGYSLPPLGTIITARDSSHIMQPKPRKDYTSLKLRTTDYDIEPVADVPSLSSAPTSPYAFPLQL